MSKSALEQLRELLPKEFGELSYAEERLLEAAATGEERDCREPGDDDEANRTIRPEVFRWLVFDHRARGFIDDGGINISGARFTMSLILSFLQLDKPILLIECLFLADVLLNDARIRLLSLNRSQLGTNDQSRTLFADRLRAAGGVILRGCTTHGTVRLLGARIGDLD